MARSTTAATVSGSGSSPLRWTMSTDASREGLPRVGARRASARAQPRWPPVARTRVRETGRPARAAPARPHYAGQHAQQVARQRVDPVEVFEGDAQRSDSGPRRDHAGQELLEHLLAHRGRRGTWGVGLLHPADRGGSTAAGASGTASGATAESTPRRVALAGIRGIVEGQAEQRVPHRPPQQIGIRRSLGLTFPGERGEPGVPGGRIIAALTSRDFPIPASAQNASTPPRPSAAAPSAASMASSSLARPPSAADSGAR